MKMRYADDIARDGFAVVQEFLNSETISVVLEALGNARMDVGEGQRAGKAFGIRNLLNVVPFTRDLASSPACRSVVEPILGPEARVVRGIYFDKHKDANWKVAWHQDLTIAVRERVDIDGYGPWSLKAGIHHVQPPVSVLENLLTLRIHLDHLKTFTFLTCDCRKKPRSCLIYLLRLVTRIALRIDILTLFFTLT